MYGPHWTPTDGCGGVINGRAVAQNHAFKRICCHHSKQRAASKPFVEESNFVAVSMEAANGSASTGRALP